jgi:hypothetical protein
VPLTNEIRTFLIDLVNGRLEAIEKDPNLYTIEKRKMTESYQRVIKAIESDISAQESLQEIKQKRIKAEQERSKNSVVDGGKVIG